MYVSILVVFGFALDENESYKGIIRTYMFQSLLYLDLRLMPDHIAYLSPKQPKVSILVVFGFALDARRCPCRSHRSRRVSILVVFGFALDVEPSMMASAVSVRFNPCCIWICA